MVRITLAGQTLAMSDGTDNAIFIATLFSELTTGDPGLNTLPLIHEAGHREETQIRNQKYQRTPPDIQNQRGVLVRCKVTTC